MSEHSQTRWRHLPGIIVALAIVIAMVGAKPYAGSWNDGSRLAAVECLAEQGTFIIDDSVFVRVPPVVADEPHVYAAEPPGLRVFGTLDKLRIDGHYYSDKSPVPTVLMAGIYRAWLICGGPTISQRPDLAIWFLTVTSSGVAYVIAVIGILRLGRVLNLDASILPLFVASFAFATVALPYGRHVNNHILLLGVMSVICLLLAKLDQEPDLSGHLWRLATVGFLAGFGYTIDLGAGPPLLFAVGLFVIVRLRSIGAGIVVAVGSLPWLILHHGINYAIAGTIGPANALPEYLNWPGSPFTVETMTGGLKHSPGWFVLYALDLLFGQKGIISNDTPLWLATAGILRIAMWQPERRIALGFCAGWCGCVWLLYAATSNNYSGQCASVRWFVPFLAPGYWMLGVLLAAEPRFRRDLIWLALIGVPIAGLMWLDGPWMPRMVPGLWAWLTIAGAGWLYITVSHRSANSRSSSGV